MVLSMLSGIKELYAFRELVGMWALREIRARYTQSIFGFAWAVFQPLALSLIFWFVASILRLPSDGIPYPIFVYVAQLPWSFFSRGLVGAVPSIVGNMNLVTKVYVPRAIFPLAAIASAFVDFLCGACVLAGMIVLYQVPIYSTLPFIIVLLIIQLLLMTGLAFFFTAINVFSRDIYQMLPLVLQIATYICPIIYPLSQVPERFRPLYLLLNPMAVIIEGYRQVLLHGQLPAPEYVIVAAAISLVVFIVGFSVFRSVEDQFADII
jgi:lipopolysaccharide transport system permease protein